MKKILLSMAVVFAAGLFIGYQLGLISGPGFIDTKSSKPSSPPDFPESESPTGMAVVTLPAVDQNGKGVATELEVAITEGDGKILVNIINLLFWVDTQNSIRTAEGVAREITGMDMSGYDIRYSIASNASVVEGSSAGAAITIATVAAVKGVELNPDVMISGTIDSDGNIGPVGGILQKAEAAKEKGATVFLVPPGQSVDIQYEVKKECSNVGPFEYCSTDTVTTEINVSEEAGIDVVEVATISEALGYFI